MDDQGSLNSVFEPDASALAAAVIRAITPPPVSLSAAMDSTGVGDLPAHLPANGIGPQGALDLLAGSALPTTGLLCDSDSTARMDSPTPWITWAGSAWVASRSANLLDYESSRPAVELHDRVMQWLAPLWGMKSGHIVPGSTIANLSAIWVARDAVGISRIVASEACHESLAKVSRVLAMPLVTLPVDGEEMLDTDALVDFARRDPDGMGRTVVVLTAGTHAAGAIDPLADAPKRLRRLGLNPPWWHVDASWAGPLALSRRGKDLLRGVDSADSVSVAAHKMMFTPTETSFVLFKDPQKADRVLEFTGPSGTSQLGLMGSRSDRALPLAMLLLAYGSEGLAGWIEQEMEAIGRVGEALFARDDVKVFAAPRSGVLLWRPLTRDVVEVAARLGAQRGRTVYAAGHRWIRNVAANPLMDSAALLAAIDEALA
ncbi:MAG: pyridoxal-dependent decarboxylase [Actinomycetes bacterium]